MFFLGVNKFAFSVHWINLLIHQKDTAFRDAIDCLQVLWFQFPKPPFLSRWLKNLFFLAFLHGKLSFLLERFTWQKLN